MLALPSARTRLFNLSTILFYPTKYANPPKVS
nr:MAG TPA: hypothetical protein [Caudoviricetes sp.]